MVEVKTTRAEGGWKFLQGNNVLAAIFCHVKILGTKSQYRLASYVRALVAPVR